MDEVWWLPGGLGGPLRRRYLRHDKREHAALSALLPVVLSRTRSATVVNVLPPGACAELAVVSPNRDVAWHCYRIPQVADSAGGEWTRLLLAARELAEELAERGPVPSLPLPGAAASIHVAGAMALADFLITLVDQDDRVCTVGPDGPPVELRGILAESVGLRLHEPVGAVPAGSPVVARLDGLATLVSDDEPVTATCPGLTSDELVASARAQLNRFDSSRQTRRDRARSVRSLAEHHGRSTVRYAIGAGPSPVVIVNALGQGPGYWWPLVAELAGRHRLLLCQQPPDGGLADHEAALRGFLADQGIQRCHLLAWCTGAKLATRFARDDPDRVLSLTVLAADFKHDGRAPALDAPYERNLDIVCRKLVARPAMADQLVTLFAGDAVPAPDDPLAQPHPELVDEIRLPLRSGPAFAGYAAQLVEFWSHDELPFAHEVRCPVLSLIGDRDEIVAPAAAAAAAARFPGAVHAEVIGGTHYLMYERPGLVADVLTDFLADPGRCVERAGGLVWTRNAGATAEV